MKATLLLSPEPGEELGPGAHIAEVQVLREDAHPDGEPSYERVDACYIERAGPLTAASRLGREPEGHPLFVYVRPEGRETNPKGV